MALPVLKLDTIPSKTETSRIAAHEVHSARVVAGVAYWNALRAARIFPRHGEIAPRGMAAFLRNVVTLRVIDGDYEYRLTGDAAVQAFGEFRGKRVSQVVAEAPEYGEMIRATYDRVVRDRAPVFVRGWIDSDYRGANYYYTETAFLPLGESEAAVDHILTINDFVLRPELARNAIGAPAAPPPAGKPAAP